MCARISRVSSQSDNKLWLVRLNIRLKKIKNNIAITFDDDNFDLKLTAGAVDFNFNDYDIFEHGIYGKKRFPPFYDCTLARA